MISGDSDRHEHVARCSFTQVSHDGVPWFIPSMAHFSIPFQHIDFGVSGILFRHNHYILNFVL